MAKPDIYGTIIHTNHIDQAIGVVKLIHDDVLARFAKLSGLDLDATLENLALLTPRESEVLAAMIKCTPNSEIATELGISSKTLDIHRNNLARKLAPPKERNRPGRFIVAAGMLGSLARELEKSRR